MTISIFELFSIGIGPSSSHTMGPMQAAFQFAQCLHTESQLEAVNSIQVELYGSLAWTGKGHHTDIAIMAGLEGHQADVVDPHEMAVMPSRIKQEKQLHLLQSKPIPFDPEQDLVFKYQEELDYHTNGLLFKAFNANQELIRQEHYYSVGGGFIISDTDIQEGLRQHLVDVPFPFQTAKQFFDYCHQLNQPLSSIIYQNELAFHTKEFIDTQIQAIWNAMAGCIERGCIQTGLMPGGLKVRRRAKLLHQKLLLEKEKDPMLWLNLYALAVNEENGSGGRVVTAPTNGAAGIVPAVLNYYMNFYPHACLEDVKRFLLSAGGIGILYKEQASISGAEVGCQGEVGVACSMAAGALAELLGGTPKQVENAAEIGMEHHLGLTCDPIGGLVQIPCIERNAMAAVRAVNAAKLAVLEHDMNRISLDTVIKTMKKTGHDMLSIYKETSQGGLAVTHTEC